MPAHRALAITKNEFSVMLSKCKPPSGWPERIAVANSGGPDSTCLMFLLDQHLRDRSHSQKLISMTVDHDLQLASASMATECAKYAKQLGVKHISSKIVWGEHPYPLRPHNARLESVARSCRYYALLQMMKAADVKVIALGQHADDQVETALMRLGKGSTEYGAGGMRPCRRWGMGFDRPGTRSFYGQDGLNKWIIRPLLDVSKDRILTTCDENSLKYVTDKTNFQPEITLRNAIRHRLQNGQSWDSGSTLLPKNIATDMKAIADAAKHINIDLNAGPEHLYDSVKALTDQVNEIDHKVSAAIDACRAVSPPGTLLLRSVPLLKVDDHLVRTALVVRALRYVSFHPWGSIKADAHRRSSSIQQIVGRLWNPHPFANGIRVSNIKTPNSNDASNITKDMVVGWLASRQPPYNKNNPAAIDVKAIIEPDVTQALIQGIDKWQRDPNDHSSSVVEVLYDTRYLVHFDLAKIPVDVIEALNVPATRVVISPATAWYLPQVYLQTRNTTRLLHSDIELHRFLRTGFQTDTQYWTNRTKVVVSDWISIEWIRPLERL
ncbi:PP-loop family-domain-containing protein [Cyathus striatus]|nr:PP-loop family-domain-containing protein [Cyathus striatus]